MNKSRRPNSKKWVRRCDHFGAFSKNPIGTGPVIYTYDKSEWPKVNETVVLGGTAFFVKARFAKKTEPLGGLTGMKARMCYYAALDEFAFNKPKKCPSCKG